MKIKILAILFSLFATCSSFAQKLQLSEECKAFSINHKTETIRKIEAFRSSMNAEINRASFANPVDGYMFLGSLFSTNPYSGLKKLEFGTLNLEKNRPLSQKQIRIMQAYCDNKGEITFDLITN
jgi:hypothetical protein